jgi:uncharacterized membrane protein YgcG
MVLNGLLKDIEGRFPGLTVKAIQDDVTFIGDPSLQYGDNGALEYFLRHLQDLGLEPNRSKFQAFTNDEGAHAAANPPMWLQRPFVITEANRKREVEEAEGEGGKAKRTGGERGGQGGGGGSGSTSGGTREGSAGGGARRRESIRSHGVRSGDRRG